jgi:hypothetical protein
MSIPTGPSTGRGTRSTSRRLCGKKKNDSWTCRTQKTLTLRVTDADNKAVLEQGRAGFGAWDGDGGPDAGLAMRGWATTAFRDLRSRTGRRSTAAGSFYVEEYKKPEYQVTVKPGAQRVLQGNSIQAVIEAKYFFGEPVANAKVKYVVHTTQHYWWDEEDDDETGEDAESDRTRRRTTQDYGMARPSSRNTRACWTRTGG